MDGNSENLGLKIDNLLSKFDQSQINLVNSIEEKINNLREEFQSTSSDVKRIKLDREFKWKREGNRDQFNFATQISEILNQSVWAIKNKKYDYALENLEEALKNLKSRIKHIKLADSSDAGWDIIKNYVQNDLVSDSDDDRKIIRAENTALRKAKRKKSQWWNKVCTAFRQTLRGTSACSCATSSSYWSHFCSVVPSLSKRAVLQAKFRGLSWVWKLHPLEA